MEQEWMGLVESPDARPEDLLLYDGVLKEFCRKGNTKKAEELAWAAIEGLSARQSARDALPVAGRFLLCIGESDELRAQAGALYRAAYADQEALTELLAEAGIEGGRPVRRALRTLDVCLSIAPGSFLTAREGDGAARVDRIDRPAWQFALTDGHEGLTLGAVELADRYEPASPEDFRVQRRFAREGLLQQLSEDPGAVIVGLCKLSGNKLDSKKLESSLVPELIAEEDWPKWWSKARTGLKRHPQILLEGRSPYVMTYLDRPVAPEAPFVAEFAALHDPIAQLAVVEKYVRDCRNRKSQPLAAVLQTWYEGFAKRAERRVKGGVKASATAWLIVRRVGELAGIAEAARGAVEQWRAAHDPGTLLMELEDPALIETALNTLIDARPADWAPVATAVFPRLSHDLCHSVALRLKEAGHGAGTFEPLIQKIMASPMECFGALLWLWDGASGLSGIGESPPVMVLSRILRVLDECRRSEEIPKGRAKTVAARARSVLSARRYERFSACLETIEPGMGASLKNQIVRLDNLGRAVPEDMVKLLKQKFPAADTRSQTPSWARDDVLYVTAAGLARKREDLDHHVNVKMKENAKAIGQAAEHGDLSENSEYKFALEERDLLRARLAQMNAELSKAETLSAEDVPIEHVGIGSRVELRRVADGASFFITFLGPWEADPAKRIVNYQAPISQSLMGKRIGETVELNLSEATGTYEVFKLENALAASR